jgi:hypothetical protein
MKAPEYDLTAPLGTQMLLDAILRAVQTVSRVKGLDTVGQPEEALVEVRGRQDNDLLDDPVGGESRFQEFEISVAQVAQPEGGHFSVVARIGVVLDAGFHLELKVDVEGREYLGGQARGHHRLTKALPMQVLKKILSQESIFWRFEYLKILLLNNPWLHALT